MNCDRPNNNPNITQGSADDITLATVDAMNELPILSRLKFAESLLVGRFGARDSSPRDMVVVMANEVIRGVIDVLEKYPRAAKLRDPQL
jgi:hypothetical protein